MAKKNFLVDIDLNKNELQNGVIQNLSADPANGKKGQLYYNTSVNKLRVFDGTEWVNLEKGNGTVSSVTINANAPLSVDDSSAIVSSGTRTVSHNTSGADAGTYGDSSSQTPSYGETFKVPTVTVDTYGHVTDISEHTVKIPDSDNTDTTYTISADTVANKVVLTPSSGSAQSITVPYATSAGSASTATSATNDANGDPINTTYVKKSGDTMTGSLILNNTSNGTTATNPFVIRRTTADTEAVKQYIIDGGYNIDLTNDEANSNIKFTINNTDTEQHSGANANTSTVTFTGDSTGSTVTATKFVGTVTRATGDKNGNDITTTYYKASNPAGYTSNIGTITGISMNGTSIATSGVANITSLPASILNGAIKNGVTATTQSQGDNSTKVATTAYVDTAIDALPEPMIFKGSLGTGGTITQLPAASSSNTGYTYKVITAGTYGGQAAKVGDTFVSDGSAWILIPSGDEPSGTVTSVKIQATSPIAVDSDAAITSSGTRTISHSTSGVTAGTYKSVTVNATGHVTAGSNPTTLSGYGITDAKINNGVITLGSNTITPLTNASTLDATKLSGTIPSGCYTNTTYSLTQDSSDGHKITLTPSNGSAQTVTIPDNNTTYTIGTGDYSGQIKITPSSGNAYNVNVNGLKALAYKDSELQTTNSFAKPSMTGLYVSKIDNAFYALDKRYNISWIRTTTGGTTTEGTTGVNVLFDGDYEGGFVIQNGDTYKFLLKFGEIGSSNYFPGYPYGNILVSFYYNNGPTSVSARGYCNYSSHGIGWHDLSVTNISGSDSQICYKIRNDYYNINQFEITIVGKGELTKVSEIEMHLDRPYSLRNPFLSKYGAETLYYDLTAPNFIGNLTGTASRATGDGSGNTITSTYLKKAGDTMTGELKYNDTNSSTFLYVGSNNQNTTLMRVYSSDQSDTGRKSAYGFSLKYLGGGSGNNNSLALYSDNQNAASQVEAMVMTQDGVAAFNAGLKTITKSQRDNSTNVATTAYVDKAIDDLPEPMIFKGSLGTGGTITSLPVNGTATVGDTYKVITAGTYAGQAAKIGDTFICDSKTSSANTWVLIPSGDEPSGTVTSITLKATSPIAIDSSSAITTSGTRTLSHANSGVTAGTYRSVTVNATGHVTAGTNPTTLSGYGITDAKIANGTITLGSNSITPLTASSTLDASKVSGTLPASTYTDTKYNFSGVAFKSGAQNNEEHDCNNAVKNGHYYYSSNGPATSLGASTGDGALYVQSYSDSWVGQIAQDYRNGNLFVRGKNNGTWQNWKKIDAGTVDGFTVAKSVPSNAVFTDNDTKNTAGSTDTSSKIYLIGATSQAANPQTYSDNEVYATSGVLTTKSVQVGGTAATMQYNSTDKCIEFVFA